MPSKSRPRTIMENKIGPKMINFGASKPEVGGTQDVVVEIVVKILFSTLSV